MQDRQRGSQTKSAAAFKGVKEQRRKGKEGCLGERGHRLLPMMRPRGGAGLGPWERAGVQLARRGMSGVKLFAPKCMLKSQPW